MGLRSALRLHKAATDLATAGLYALEGGTAYGDVASSPAAAAAFGVDTAWDSIDRQTAMTIPAVRRGRQVICGTIGALPLVARRTSTDADGTTTVADVTSSRPLLTQPDPNVTRSYLLTWTVDDLLFYGIAWWRITARDPEGFPKSVERLRPDRVMVDLARGTVRVDGQAVGDKDVIRFDGPDEGVLTYGGRTLRTFLLLEEAVRKFSRLDVPLGVLKLAEGAAELSTAPGSCGIAGDERSEVDYLLDSWEDARRRRTTAYLNRAVDYSNPQFSAEALQLADARQFMAAEVARLLNIAPRYVNAPSASSMTYSNVSDDRRDLVDTSLVGFLAAITDRLSMGDVTPRGTAVSFDLTSLLRGDQLTALQAAEVAVRLQAMTPAEVRSGVLGLPPLDSTPTTPPSSGGTPA